MKSFIAFNINAISNFLYILSSNIFFFMLIVSVVGTIILLLKDEIDDSVREEQNIL